MDGERVHLVDARSRIYTLTLRHGMTYQHSGERIAHDEIIGKEEGGEIVLSRGHRFIVLRPTLAEYILKMPRGAQIIYPKDLGMILVSADVFPGASVVEAGIGSGALTIALLRAVGEAGRVVSYENREDFARRGQTNVTAFLGKVANLTVTIADIYEGIGERDVDRVILDLPEPWQVAPHAASALRAGGIFLSFVPTVPQVQQVTDALRREGFFDVQTSETLVRSWNIDGRSVRPDHRMIAHTGFLTTARKIARGGEPPSV